MYRGRKIVRRGNGNPRVRGQNTTKTKPMTRQQSTLLFDKDQTMEKNEQFALVKLVLSRELLIVNYNDLRNLNKQEKTKLGSDVLVKINEEELTSAILFCVGSTEECLDELNLIKDQRHNNINSDHDDSFDDTPLLITTIIPKPTQKETNQNKKTKIPGETAYISFDINQDESNIQSSSRTLSSKNQPSPTRLMAINYSQVATTVASSLTSSTDIAATTSKHTSSTDTSAATSKPASSAINANTVTTTLTKKQNRMDALSDLTVKLNDLTAQIKKWEDKYKALEKRYSTLSDASIMIPTDDATCEWISTLYDVVQRQVNSDVDYDTEATNLGIPLNLLKYCVKLSKPPTITARRLFEQICLDELTKNLPWSKFPDDKIEAIHIFGEKLFGLLKWDRKVIKTSLQNLVRGERANLVNDQENGGPNEANLNHNGLILVECVPEQID